jgi:hypothetical protein
VLVTLSLFSTFLGSLNSLTYFSLSSPSSATISTRPIEWILNLNTACLLTLLGLRATRLISGNFFFFQTDIRSLPHLASQPNLTQPVSAVALSEISQSTNAYNTSTFLEPTGLNSWASESATGDSAPSVFNAANSGGGFNYDPQVNLLDGNVSSSFTPNPGFVIGGQDIFTQPLAFDNCNVGFDNFQHEDFNTALTSMAVGFSPLGFDNSGASGFQNHGSQHAWDQTPVQNDFATGFSWGQSINDTAFNPIFQPLNPDEGFVDTGFGFPTPWSPDTSMEGHFQSGVGSAVTAPSTQWNGSNVPFDLTLSSPSMNDSNLSPIASTSAPPPAAPAPNPRQPNASIPCTNPTCTRTFKRHFERIRHEASVHRTNRQRHLCPITGCSKSHGKGYTRSDKVTEHLWKKHANLGYTKA